MEEWRQMKKGKGKGVIRKAFESAGSALLDAGKGSGKRCCGGRCQKCCNELVIM